MFDSAPPTAPAPPLVLPRIAGAPVASRRSPEPWSFASQFAARCRQVATPWRSRRALRRARLAARRVAALAHLPDDDLDARLRAATRRLRLGGMVGEALTEALALVALVAERVLGLRPHQGQLAAAAGLAAGYVVEMDTGEGKTLAAFLAASVCGLAQRRVHVVTANDYLAERDGAALGAAFARLGLTVGVVTGGLPTEARRTAYAADICFLAGKEAAFDYLRDGLTRGSGERGGTAARTGRRTGDVLGGSSRPPLQPDLDIAIVDEIDSVLIDEAGTPLIISADGEDGIDAATGRLAFELADELLAGRHVRAGANGGWPDMTAAGADFIEMRSADRGEPWSVRLRREEIVRAALVARDHLLRDRDYIVRDGKVVIVDPHTGRVMPDRQWGNDVHALVEVKEGLAPSRRRKSLASISFQRFFRNYRMVAGMSGTVREVASELAAVYGLPLVCVPRRRPLRRHWAGRRVFADRDLLWRALGDDVLDRHRRGQPVMVAVRSVEESRRAATALERLAVPFRLLSADQDREEAATVAEAGQLGAVTVVTNMAGRGTDIRLGVGVADRNGLAVLICERHQSRRVDRQLMGRAARQGDPGEVAEFLSVQDDMLAGLSPSWHFALRRRVLRDIAAMLAFRHVQTTSDRHETRRRLALVQRDEQLARALAFAGGLD